MAEIDISDVLRRARKNCSGTSKASTEGRAVLAHIERQAAEIERLRAAMPDGWRLVPGEPTIAMCIAGDSPRALRMTMDDCTPTAAIYRAMIAAAPEPPPRNKGNAERMADAMRVADARYAYLRTITPGQLAQLQKIAREGELTFDQAVDEARAWRG